MSKLNDYTLRSDTRRAALNVTFVQPDVSDESAEPQAPDSDVVITKPKKNCLFEANDAEQQNVEEANGGSQADNQQGSRMTEVDSIEVSSLVGAGDKREHGLSKTKWKGDEFTTQSVMLDPYVPGYVRVQSGPSSEEGNGTPWTNTGLDPQPRATSGKSMGDGFESIPNRSSIDLFMTLLDQIELDEMSYLFHIIIGKNAAPSVDYVGSFKLICQLMSHDHYRLRAQYWLYFFIFN